MIGVVGDTRDTALAAAPSQVVYFPETLESGGVTAQTRRTMALVIREDGRRPSPVTLLSPAPYPDVFQLLRDRGSSAIGQAVHQAVRELDPTVPTFDVRPMSAVVDAATAQLTFVITLLGAAAAVTLVLGAIGLYGVLAYVVTLRTRELSIRISLGATPNAVAASMARYGLGLTGLGIAIGLVLFGLVARSLRAFLFGVSVADPLALGGAAGTLVAVALLASWLPARRAARIDPASALRSD